MHCRTADATSGNLPDRACEHVSSLFGFTHRGVHVCRRASARRGGSALPGSHRARQCPWVHRPYVLTWTWARSRSRPLRSAPCPEPEPHRRPDRHSLVNSLWTHAGTQKSTPTARKKRVLPESFRISHRAQYRICRDTLFIPLLKSGSKCPNIIRWHVNFMNRVSPIIHADGAPTRLTLPGASNNAVPPLSVPPSVSVPNGCGGSMSACVSC
jgi:hypothetical protein